jgi:glycosyltransferase involved in cell wall biosynthesis
MNIAFDYTVLGLTNGNSAYTTGLIKGLATVFPDNQYYVFSYLKKKRRSQKAVGNLSSVKINGILIHPLILGKIFSPTVNVINDALIRYTNNNVNRVDLYHSTNPTNYTFGLNRTVLTIHDLIALLEQDWATPKAKAFYRDNIGRIISDADAIIAVSNHTRSDIIRFFPEAEEKTFVIHLGIEDRFKCYPQSDRSFLKAFGYPEDYPPFLLYVGETQPRKNVLGLITAYAELPLSVKEKYHLVIVGNTSRTDYKEKLFSLVNQRSIQDRIHFYTDVSHDDLVKFYNAAHAFIFPSFYEGFGIPVAEAMKCGCPVLTSASSSLPEVGGDAALYAEPNDIDDLKEKLRQIIEDEELRKTLREKGFVQASKFDWKKAAELTHDVYLKI